MIKSEEFSDIEFRNILAYSYNLIRHGYFTGVNFIKSDEKLPDESILIHFLHDDKKHLEKIIQEVNLPHKIIPRFTFYTFDRKYITRKNFGEEYKNATFYDKNFNVISVEDVVKKEHVGLKVTREELDLIIPYKDKSITDIIFQIQEADRKEKISRWTDPVIIIKTKHLIETVPNFKNNICYVSITRHKEEFYTIVNEDFIATALKKYIKNLCKKVKIGDLNENSIKFNLGQINIEFYNYIVRNLQPFESSL